jgi:tight adherence protein B
VGLAIAAVLWGVLDEPLLSSAMLVAWIGVTRLLRVRRARRVEDEELRYAVEAIGTAGRALRSGIPMAGVLRILADETRGTAREAFREVLARESLGEDLASGIRGVLLRSSVPALRAFGLALIQHVSAGGNIADVTDRLAQSLVERTRIRRRTQTILAYGRSASFALALTPLVAVPMLCELVDGYAQLLLDTPTGHALIVSATVLLVLGTVTIQRLSNVEPIVAGRMA